MIKIQMSLVLQSIQLIVLSTAAVFNYLNLRNIRHQVDVFMDKINTQTVHHCNYPEELHYEHFYVLDPKEPITIPLKTQE